MVDDHEEPAIPRDAAEVAFKKATTKPAGDAGAEACGAHAKEIVSLRIDRDVLDFSRRAVPGWQDRINDELRKAAGL